MQMSRCLFFPHDALRTVSNTAWLELKLENPSWLCLGCLTPIFLFRIIKYLMLHVIVFKDLLDLEDETKSDEEEEEEEEVSTKSFS